MTNTNITNIHNIHNIHHTVPPMFLLFRYSQIPMWHKVGGMVVTTDAPGLRVDDQDWSELVVDVYVDATNGTTGT